jgi:hypothetical protein
MRPFDTVILTTDLSDSLRAGTVGTIVDTYAQVDDVYIVELFDGDGRTLNVVDVNVDQMIVTLADFFAGEQVALLGDLPAHKLLRGQVGVIRERVGVGVYRVEFAGTDGAAYASLTLHAGQMMLLHWHPDAAKATA